MATGVDAVRALLDELERDDYVRFKHGKALGAARKALDARPEVDTTVLEEHLTQALELLRGKKGAGQAGSGPKSPRRPRREAADVPA